MCSGLVGKGSAEYKEGREQNSVGRAFSPDAGVKPVRGEGRKVGTGQEELRQQSSSEKVSARSPVRSPKSLCCAPWWLGAT